MLQMKIKTGRRTVVPGDLPSILGAQRAYRELGDMVEALIAQMDMLAGDCDLEPEMDEWDVDDEGERDTIDWAMPAYGADQTRAPDNLDWIRAEEVRREHTREIPAFIAEITGRRFAA